MQHTTSPLSRNLVIAATCGVLFSGAVGAGASSGLLAGPVVTRQVAETGSSIAWGEAEAELGTSIEEILPVVSDYAGYEAFMPNFRRSRVLAQRSTRARVYMEVSAAAGALTLWGQLDLRAHPEEGSDAQVVEATLLEGNIEAFRAAWRLEPSEDGEHTRVAFKIYVDPDLPLPGSLISRENERAARRSIEALRTHLEGKLP